MLSTKSGSFDPPKWVNLPRQRVHERHWVMVDGSSNDIEDRHRGLTVSRVAVHTLDRSNT